MRIAPVLVLFPVDVLSGRDTDIVREEHHVSAGARFRHAGVHRADAEFHRAIEAVARGQIRIRRDEGDRPTYVR